jgi:hypothetical protein
MNVLYPKFKEAALKALVDLSAVTVKALLVDTGAYTYGAAHEFLSDIPAGARIASSAALGSKTFTDGVFDAADTVFTAVSGATVEARVLYVDTGVAGTSRLIQYTDADTGLPLTPNGADVNLAFDNGASRIFAL